VPTRDPLVLAALASVAIPGLEPVGARGLGGQGEADVDSAEVRDDAGRTWVVRAPRTPSAAAALEQEWRFLGALTGRLPFAVPLLSGTTPLPEGGRAGVHRSLEGGPMEVSALAPGPGLAAALGRALAAVHDLPARLAEEAELPVYTAAGYRDRRMAELDRAAATGHVPPGLLGRWERALEEAGAWRFTPCVVHGDLAAENVLVAASGDGERITGVLGWGQARVADPADDLAWLVAGAPAGAVESVLEAYAHTRQEAPDSDLVRRARLAGELALARWLLHGTTTGDEGVVADAVGMLAELEAGVDGSPW
jgi:aminoglycoside phosphotransferase (APT) family kinase protein